MVILQKIMNKRNPNMSKVVSGIPITPAFFSTHIYYENYETKIKTPK